MKVGQGEGVSSSLSIVIPSVALLNSFALTGRNESETVKVLDVLHHGYGCQRTLEINRSVLGVNLSIKV